MGVQLPITYRMIEQMGAVQRVVWEDTVTPRAGEPVEQGPAEERNNHANQETQFADRFEIALRDTPFAQIIGEYLHRVHFGPLIERAEAAEAALDDSRRMIDTLTEDLARSVAAQEIFREQLIESQIRQLEQREPNVNTAVVVAVIAAAITTAVFLRGQRRA